VTALYRDSGTWVNPSIIHIHEQQEHDHGWHCNMISTDNTVAHLWFYSDEAHQDPPRRRCAAVPAQWPIDVSQCCAQRIGFFSATSRYDKEHDHQYVHCRRPTAYVSRTTGRLKGAGGRLPRRREQNVGVLHLRTRRVPTIWATTKVYLYSYDQIQES